MTNRRQTIEFEYHLLEVIKSDSRLLHAFGTEIAKDNLDTSKLEQILCEAAKRDSTIAKRKVKHAIENQLPSTKQVIREVGVQNPVDAYSDLTRLLAKRRENIPYPLKIKLDHFPSGEGVQDLQVRDYAIGINLYDVLYKLLAVGDDLKKEKGDQLGGHGRGFKPSIYFSNLVEIESFRRKIIIRKEEQSDEIKYFISIGNDSNVNEGLKITLKGFKTPDDVSAVVGEFARKLGDAFEYTVNGICINNVGETEEFGKIVHVETDKFGSGLELTDRLVSCSSQVQGLEVKQGPMTLFSEPAEMDNTHRTLEIPPGHLLSRSRNEKITEVAEVAEVIERKGKKPYKRFYEQLLDNFHKIGAHEFRFLDQFSDVSERYIRFKRGVLRTVRNSAFAFLGACALAGFVGECAVPVYDQIKDELANIRPRVELVDNNSKSSGPPPSKGKKKGSVKYGNSHTPWVHVYDAINQAYKIDENSRTLVGKYNSRAPIFFKMISHNSLRKNGTWYNKKVKCLHWDRDVKVNDPRRKLILEVRLNLDIHEKASILPMPVGYVTSLIDFKSPDQNSLEIHYNPCFIKGGGFDSITAKSNIKIDLRYPVKFTAGPMHKLNSDLEERFSKPPGRRDKRALTKTKIFIDVPFKVEYPSGLDDELRRIERANPKPRAGKNYAINMRDWTRKIVSQVRPAVGAELIYNTSKESAERYKNTKHFVNGPLQTKDTDCDVANGIYATILRDRFGIATRLALGIQGIAGLIDTSKAHGIAEVYVPTVGWEASDSTPSNFHKEMFNTKPKKPDLTTRAIRKIFGKDYKDDKEEDRHTFSVEDSDDEESKKPEDDKEEKSEREKREERKREEDIKKDRSDLSADDSGIDIDLEDVKTAIEYIGLGLGGSFFAYSTIFLWLEAKRYLNLRDQPFIDILVKDDNSTYADQISINQGMQYAKRQQLQYSQKVSEGGLEELARQEHKPNNYVVDHNNYSLLLEMAKIAHEQQYLKKSSRREVAPQKIRKADLECVAFSEDSFDSQWQPRFYSQYRSRVQEIQQVMNDIAESNGVDAPEVCGQYVFSKKEKLFSFTDSDKQIFVNIEHAAFRRRANYIIDREVVDGLIVTYLLAKGENLGDFGEIKRNYLNHLIGE